MPPPLLLPLMAIGMYPDGILVLLLLLMLMGKKVVLVRCIYLYEMLPMLLSPPMPLPLPSMSMDPALRLEQRKVLMVLGPDHLEQGFYPEMSTLMGY